MKRTLLIVLAAAALGSGFSSCKKSSNSYNNGTTTGQPAMDVILATANTSYPLTPANPGTSAGLQWTSAFANPDVIVFQATQNNVQVQLKSTNSQQIDLMSSLAVSFGNFVLPAGYYDKTSLKIDLDKNGTSPSMELNGQFTNGATSVPVTIDVTNSVELQTDQDSVTVTNDSTYDAITTIDLSSITAGITATMLLNAQLTNGTIMISQTSNHGLYEMVLDNLVHHAAHCWFHHHDHDGH